MISTHIGSLPFQSIEEAIEFNQRLDLPVLSTLPLLDANEFMLEQVALGIPSAQVQSFKIFLPETVKLFDYEFSFITLQETIKAFHSKSIKWQIVGPLTLVNSLVDKTHSKRIIEWHTKNIINYHLKLKSYFKDVILFLDEPLLSGDLEVLKKCCENLKQHDLKLGIHSCANFNPQDLLNFHFDVLSYDSAFHQAKDLRDLKNKSIMLCGGVLHTSELSIQDDQYELLDFVAPACGMAFSDPNMVKKVPEMLQNKSV